MATSREGPTEGVTARELRRLAWLLDESIPLPGGYRIGLDGIVGLIPGVGDAAGLAASSYILLRARRYGVPRVVMARMLGNVLLDFVVGAIPVLGDLFDFGFKANRRNIGLMQQYLVDERGMRRRSWAKVLVTVVTGLALILLVLFLVFRLVQWLWDLAAV
jgi:hypothetical protein